MVTELLMLRGSEREGGSAGFGIATDNDAPLAAKAHVIGTAFLGVEMECARCHDSPYHETTQRDLFSLAAMLGRKELTVPASSTVPSGFFDENKGRQSLIQVTLAPGEVVKPLWPFMGMVADEERALQEAEIEIEDSRARLAALVTSANNERFAKVMVNRLWKRLMGVGIVEPVHDWEGQTPSHPQLLDWLASELLVSGYDQKHVLRLIMKSDAYAKEARGWNENVKPDRRYFAAPERRRLSAEQTVDSLFASSGLKMDVEELTFDPDGRRPAKTMISLGFPRRAWELASLSNERDRPSLALPKAQAVCDVLEAFGWEASRQGPVNLRRSEQNLLQPGVLANSTLSTWITNVSADSPMAELALQSKTVEDLVESLFLRFLSRLPGEDESRTMTAYLQKGFSERRVPADQVRRVPELPRLPRVSWTNHLNKEANRLKLIMEKRALDGEPADPRIDSKWRERFEDVIWSLINTPEFIWIP